MKEAVAAVVWRLLLMRGLSQLVVAQQVGGVLLPHLALHLLAALLQLLIAKTDKHVTNLAIKINPIICLFLAIENVL